MKSLCAGCHRLFSGMSAFEAHRKGGKCATDEDLEERGYIFSPGGVPSWVAGAVDAENSPAGYWKSKESIPEFWR